MKTAKPVRRLKAKRRSSHLGITFTIYRKYKNHQKLVRPDLL